MLQDINIHKKAILEGKFTRYFLIIKTQIEFEPEKQHERRPHLIENPFKGGKTFPTSFGFSLSFHPTCIPNPTVLATNSFSVLSAAAAASLSSELSSDSGVTLELFFVQIEITYLHFLVNTFNGKNIKIASSGKNIRFLLIEACFPTKNLFYLTPNCNSPTQTFPTLRLVPSTSNTPKISSYYFSSKSVISIENWF